MIFSRGRSTGRHAKGDRSKRGDVPVEPDESTFDDEDASSARTHGPWDVSTAPAGIAHLDLGALRIPAVEGVEVRVQADPEGRIQQVILVQGDSSLQLGVFAAPRSEPIWDEVRQEIRDQLFTDGVAAQENDGEYGVELRARVRTAEGLADLRFVGIDGPRWLVRAVFQGPAAIDPETAPALLTCLRRLVVDRGTEAKPVREPLALQLPAEVADQAEAGADSGEVAAATGPSPDAPKANSTGGNGAAQKDRPSPGGRRRPSPRPRS